MYLLVGGLYPAYLQILSIPVVLANWASCTTLLLFSTDFDLIVALDFFLQTTTRMPSMVV